MPKAFYSYISVFAVLLTLLASQRTDAGVIVSIDWDPSLAGIQSDIATTVGSNVTADLVLDLTGATTLSSYGFSLRFDTDELNYVSRTETPPLDFNEIDFSNPFTENTGLNFAPIVNYGEFLRFDGGALGIGIAAPDQYVIGSLIFQAVAPAGTFTDVDVLGGTFEPVFDGFFDSNGDDLLLTGQVQFNSGSVGLQSGTAAVPEPGSFVLLAIAFATATANRSRLERKLSNCGVE